MTINSEGRGPGVAVWTTSWLGAPETFIRNQVDALRRYRPLRLGITTQVDPLVAPDFAPFRSDSRSAQVVSAAIIRGVGLGPWVRRARAHGVEVVHAHYGTGGLMAAPLARRLGVPLVVTFHGFDATSLPARDPSYLARCARLFEEATIIIAVSDFIAAKLLAMGAPADKIVVHYIGVPTQSAPAVARARDGIAFVGRFTAKKGITDLIAAVDRLPEPLRSTPLRLAGFGELEGDIRALADDLGVRTEFLGLLSSSEVADLLGRSQVFAAPSKTAPNGDAEGLGMVFLEAALASAPVVSYRHGGVPEAVADGVTGVLAPEGDVLGLTRALESVLGDPVRAAALGEAGRNRVLDKFDISKNTAALEDIFDRASALHDAQRSGRVG